MSTTNFNLVPKKYHHILFEVTDNFGVVEVVLKEGWEYDNGASLACYERDEADWCKADGSRSEHKLKRCIAGEIEMTNEVPLEEWRKNH